VRSGIRFNTLIGTIYTAVAWLLVLLFPALWFGIFSSDPVAIEKGTEMLGIYFFGFVFMAFQFSGQSTFQALGDARHAIFFSLFRKVLIVVPLTLLLPQMGFGVRGVFLAEPVSNIVGGLACFITMMLTRYREIRRKIE
jgi:Na+-driven multidrug efflux pump